MINEYWLIAAAIAAVAVYTAAALKKKTPYDRIVLYVIFILYMAGLIGVTMFPVIFDHSLMGAMDEPMYRIKLIPFEIIMEELRSTSLFNAVVQLAGNIIMTVPFGLFFTLLYPRRHWYGHILAALMLPLCIELTQLLLDVMTGTWYRTADIDDIFLNFTGVIIGVLLCCALPEKFRKRFLPGDKGEDI